METVSEYKNSPDPLLRATYWLIRFAWDNPKRFEILQELSMEVEAVSKQNTVLVAVAQGLIDFEDTALMDDHVPLELIEKAKQALAQAGKDE